MSRFKKMNQNIKERWVKALRSGKFKQTTNILYDDFTDGYCCLGVLQTLIEPENKEGAMSKDGYFAGVPTATCLKAAGLPRYRPSEKGALGKLMAMNDEDGAGFEEIADFIEENL